MEWFINEQQVVLGLEQLQGDVATNDKSDNEC
jgi:hypothetical protein